MSTETDREAASPALAAAWRILLPCVAVLVFTACSPTPYSSPTALRDTNAYFKAISPAVPGALDPQALDRITVTREGDTLIATYPTRSGAEDENDGFPHVVDRLKPGEKLEGDGASFEMVAFGVSGPGISKTSTNRNRSVPLDYFGPDGKPLNAAELKTLGFKKWELVDYPSGEYGGDYSFPKLRVMLGPTQQPPGYYSVVELFDARTKQAFSTGLSYSQISSNYLGRVEGHPRAWQATPMELVLDVELDGKSVSETNPVPGMHLAVPGGEVKLLGIWDGDARSWSQSSGGAGSLATMRISLTHSENRPNAVALFVTEPPRLAVHFDLLDGHGKVLAGRGGGSSGPIRMAGLRGVAADVKRVRFTVFTNHHRVVLTLPPIPNLPPEYQHVNNLFDVRIPQVRLERDYELRQLIGSATEMKFAYTPWQDGIPTNRFPLIMTNVTPAQLVGFYRRNLTNGCTVVVDEAKQEIRVEPTQFERIKSWLKQKLRL